MRVALAVVAVVAAGCATWGPAADALRLADRLAVEGDLVGAARAYESALATATSERVAVRARAGRAATMAAIAAGEEARQVRDELDRRGQELERLRRDLAAHEREVARLLRDLAAREGDLTRMRADLSARQAEVKRLGLEAEELRSSLEDLKRIEMRLERRR